MGISEHDIEKIAELRDGGEGGSYKVITKEDVQEILKIAI
jgi:hypothetical protein